MRRLLFAVPILMIGAIAYAGHSHCGHGGFGYSSAGCSGYAAGCHGVSYAGCHGASSIGCSGSAGYWRYDSGNQPAPAPASIPNGETMTRDQQIQQLNELQSRMDATQRVLDQRKRELGIAFRR